MPIISVSSQKIKIISLIFIAKLDMDSLQDTFEKLSFKELNFCKVKIFHHSKSLLHKSSKKHPEQPARIENILTAISKYAELSIVDVQQLPGALSQEQIEKLAVQVQGQSYIGFVKEMWDTGSKRTEMYINTDTYYGKHTFESAIAAATAAIEAVKVATCPPYPYTFAVVRPPGHHCGLKAQPHGFSFINNVALAAQFMLNTKKAAKIVIVDWDAHHGQGTQTLFYKNKQVLYVSLHRFDNGKYFPHIPQSGSENVGESGGEGFNINICWNLPQKPSTQGRSSEETVGDKEYMSAFRAIVMPVVREYDPEVILVSCGFDSAEGDPIGALGLTKCGYAFMTSSLASLGKPLSLVLEGGYCPSALEWATQAIVRTLAQDSNQFSFPPHTPAEQTCNEIGRKAIDYCLKYVGPFWKCLQQK